MLTDREGSISVTRIMQFELQVVLVLLAANATAWLLGNNFAWIPLDGRLAKMFLVDHELNVPTLFSVLLLIQASLLSFVALRCERGNLFWGLLAVVFLALSLDEMASLHEQLIRPVREALGVSGFLHFAWIIPGAVFVLILAILGVKWLRALPSDIRRGFIIAAALYLGAVFLLEAVGGWYGSRIGLHDTIWWLLTTTEETLEMLGLILFGYYAALHIVCNHGLNRIRISVATEQ